MEGHCLQVMKIVHHHANGRFDWLISEHQGDNPSRETISVLSGKYKRFTFVHLVYSQHYVITQYISLRCTVVNELYRMTRMGVASHRIDTDEKRMN